MAGSIFGLGMSQRVDANGKPAVGWLLYIYAANSSTPSSIWQDTALTIAATWPLAADANGMLPPFWLADGSYRVRGTSADGSTTYFDIQTVLALGASSGSAPSGGVDPTTIFATGDVLWLDVQGTRSGWVRDNGRTIGSATSGATERANADAQALFQYLWNNFSNTICPVSGGRGGSSLADWTANKQIGMPDKRGYIPGGLDDMGNSAKGAWASVPIVSGSVTTAGSVLGEATHLTTTAEMPSHQHSVFVKDPGHFHAPAGAGNKFLVNTTGTTALIGGNSVALNTQVDTTTDTTGLTIGSVNGVANDNQTATIGGGGAHNNVQQTVLGTFYRKL